jgi:hypothetical protein
VCSSLAALELVGVHLLVSRWSVAAAFVLSALSLGAMVQIALLIQGLVRFRTEVDQTFGRVRHGRAGCVPVPIASIESADYVAFAPEERGPHVFRTGLIAAPNIALRLSKPVQVRRAARTVVTLRLDEPQAFLSLLHGRMKQLRAADSWTRATDSSSAGLTMLVMYGSASAAWSLSEERCFVLPLRHMAQRLLAAVWITKQGRADFCAAAS